MIGITAATGQLGHLVVKSLLDQGVKPADIAVLVRDPVKAADLAAQGISVRHADYKDPASLVAALKGIEKLLLISSNDFHDRAGQHRNVIDAAKAAGVGYVAYTSILRADTSPIALAADHKATEDALTASGLKHAFLRHGWYAENYTASIQAGPQYGALIGAAGQGRISAAARADYAAADAAVMRQGLTGVFELAGDQAFSMDELAALVAKISGKPAVYSNMPMAAYEEALKGMGLPGPVAFIFAQSDSCIADGWLEDHSRTLSGLTGKPTTAMAETVKAVLG
jgi:NAD(P)H dehydrogenase (quinone)